jgi:hypothetical protein
MATIPGISALWVISGHRFRSESCPLYPRKADIAQRQHVRSGYGADRHAGLLPVGFRDLADQLGPVHIERPIDRAGLGPTVVFEDFDHEGRVV